MNIKEQILSLTKDYIPLKDICLELLDDSYKNSSDYILLNRQPKIAPEYYAIYLFFGMAQHRIEEYQSIHSINIPDFYQTFLRNINGFSVFSFTLFGIAKSMLNKTPLLDRSKIQSMDISVNSGFYKSSFLFGYRHYTFEKNIDYYLTNSNKVLGRVDKQIVSEWDDFNLFLEDEIKAAREYHVSDKKLNIKKTTLLSKFLKILNRR